MTELQKQIRKMKAKEEKYHKSQFNTYITLKDIFELVGVEFNIYDKKQLNIVKSDLTDIQIVELDKILKKYEENK